ncbi:19200_t:CDS:2 [Entrophospora sp. SA101]|nr:19200_t:CDS:2 [Entrophospora sp. SA101]
MPKLHELTAKIISKELRKVYKKNEFYGQINYQLKVLPEETNSSQPETILVYANLVNQQLLQILEQNQYLDKRYFFTCHKKKSVENLKEALKLLEDKVIKGKYDEFGQPLTEERLCSLVDNYQSEEEDQEI